MAVNWQDVVTSVSATVGGGAALLGASAWVIRTVLTSRLSRDTEAFKAKLQADTNFEIERLRNSLQMAALEHQVRFSRLHERRAEVIAEMYRTLVDIFWSGQRFVLTGINPTTHFEEYSELIRKINDFALFVDAHAIYLPSRICSLLDAFVDRVRKAVIHVGVQGLPPFPNEETHRQRADAVMKAYQAFETDIPVVKRGLEHEFRDMLGVDTATAVPVPEKEPSKT
jgi:uncharacterized protein YjaG (DUF416 family)